MKPGDYPLHSSQSRAAARHALKQRKATEGEGTFIRVHLVGSSPRPDQKCICPHPPAGTFQLCRCFCEPR
jgi:hypothetical protein